MKRTLYESDGKFIRKVRDIQFLGKVNGKKSVLFGNLVGGLILKKYDIKRKKIIE